MTTATAEPTAASLIEFEYQDIAYERGTEQKTYQRMVINKHWPVRGILCLGDVYSAENEHAYSTSAANRDGEAVAYFDIWNGSAEYVRVADVPEDIKNAIWDEQGSEPLGIYELETATWRRPDWCDVGDHSKSDLYENGQWTHDGIPLGVNYG